MTYRKGAIDWARARSGSSHRGYHSADRAPLLFLYFRFCRCETQGRVR